MNLKEIRNKYPRDNKMIQTYKDILKVRRKYPLYNNSQVAKHLNIKRSWVSFVLKRYK